MNLNQGKRNKQAVQVLNKVEYDSEGNPIGMMEDPSNPASANFGTPREPRRGGCYKGDGSAYITITGLLSTDTVEVFDGSDMPTISNGRLDISSGDRVFGVKIFRAGELWAKYNCSENSGDIAYDSSGNGNHGTIINAITTTPEENPNSIHQYQDVYSFENEEGYSDADLYRYSNDYAITGVQSVTKISEGSKLVFSVPYRTISHTPAVTIGKNNNFNRFSRGLGIKYRVRFTIKTDTNTPSAHSFAFRMAGGPAGYILSSSGTIPILTANTPTSIDTILTDNGSCLDYIIRDIGIRFDNVVVTPYDIIYEISNLTVEVYSSRIIPRNESIQLPPFKDVLGNNLQYVGKVPGKAKFVNSSCFLSDDNAYLSGDVLTTDTITAHSESEVPVCTTDGRLDFPIVSGKYFDITIERGGSVIARLPLCEPIIDPSNHIYHDVSGNGNHATLVNGTLANEGKQDKFHYLQKGLVKRSTGEIIPILEDESGFADGSLLNDVDAITQDSHSFLNTGTELEAYDYPALKQADKDDDFWNEDDGLGTVTPKPVQFDSLITQKELSDKLFLDSSVSSTIKNIRMYGSDLKGRQLNTENKLTNN